MAQLIARGEVVSRMRESELDEKDEAQHIAGSARECRRDWREKTKKKIKQNERQGSAKRVQFSFRRLAILLCASSLSTSLITFFTSVSCLCKRI
jgi:hypothetical protein